MTKAIGYGIGREPVPFIAQYVLKLIGEEDVQWIGGAGKGQEDVDVANIEGKDEGKGHPSPHALCR